MSDGRMSDGRTSDGRTSDGGMITDYLIELMAELRGPARRRRRILAEVEDHLSCAAADLHAAGLDPAAAEHEAVSRFGSAAELARGFAEERAAISGRRLGYGSGALVAALLLMLFPVSSPLLGPAQPGFPAGVVAFVLAQVALVTGGITLIRTWRAAAAGGVRGGALTLVLRGVAVIVTSAIGAVACGVAGVAHAGAAGVAHAGAARTPLTWIALAGIALTAVVGAGALIRTWRTAAAAGLLPAAPADEHDPVAGLAATVTRSVPWLDLSRHPWRFATTVSLAAGIVFAAGHGLTEGGVPSPDQLPRVILAGAIIASVETLASLLGFAVLARFLGIRQPQPQR